MPVSGLRAVYPAMAVRPGPVPVPNSPIDAAVVDGKPAVRT